MTSLALDFFEGRASCLEEMAGDCEGEMAIWSSKSSSTFRFLLPVLLEDMFAFLVGEYRGFSC